MINLILFNPELLSQAIQTSLLFFFIPCVIFDYLYYLEVSRHEEEEMINNYVTSNKSHLYTLIKLLIFNIVINYLIDLSQVR